MRRRDRRALIHRAWAAVCFAAGTWLFILGGILCSGGFWWGALLIAVAALELWIGYRLLHSVQTPRGQSSSP
jgi:hypothetical protein